jgi:hypothetical protein
VFGYGVDSIIVVCIVKRFNVVNSIIIEYKGVLGQIMPKSFSKAPKWYEVFVLEPPKKKSLFVNCKKKALFVNIAGHFCVPFNSDFRVTEIPE